MIVMRLKNKLFGLASFSLIDTALTKAMGGVSFFIIVHILARSDIGLIGLVGGYLVIISVFAIRPERIMLRDFSKMKGTLHEHISAFTKFWFLRTIAILIVSIIFSSWIYFSTGNLTAAIYLLGTTIALNLNLFQHMIKDIFFVSFRQKLVAQVNAVLKLMFLGLLLFLYMESSVLTYMLILIASAIINSYVWFHLLKKSTGFKFKNTKNFFRIIRKSLSEFSIWSYLYGTVNNLVYRIDTLVLGLFTTLTVIGNYTIALEIANFFFIVPMILQSSIIVGIANLKDEKMLGTVMGIFLKYFFLLSIGQLLFFILFGNAIVSFFTTTSVEVIFSYTLIILTGITILNVVRPLIALIMVKTDLKKGFFRIFLPASITGITGYVILGSIYGAVGVAYGNILAYFVMAFLIVLFLVKEYPVRPQFALFCRMERELLNDMLPRKHR